MFQIFRMLRLVIWYEAIYKKKSPSKIKQRVKLRRDSVPRPSPLNPEIGSPAECFGTVLSITDHKAKVQWDNNHRNTYPMDVLVVKDIPLRSMPKFIIMSGSNPNTTFKNSEHYEIIEREWYEREKRIELKKAAEANKI